MSLYLSVSLSGACLGQRGTSSHWILPTSLIFLCFDNSNWRGCFGKIKRLNCDFIKIIFNDRNPSNDRNVYRFMFYREKAKHFLCKKYYFSKHFHRFCLSFMWRINIVFCFKLLLRPSVRHSITSGTDCKERETSLYQHLPVNFSFSSWN